MSLGDEVIEFDTVLCFLQPQPRAGLGGTFEFTAQGQGTNAAGEPVLLDVSRATPDPDLGFGDDEPSDDVIIDVGDPRDPLGYGASGPVGTVELDGSSVSAEGVSVTAFTDAGELSELEVSFQLDCG